MKAVAVLLLVVYAAVARAGVPGSRRVVGVDECPTDQATDWTIEHLMRHENCHMFYQCTHGAPIERYCYGDLWFNLDTWQCDWPHNVDCTGRIEPSTTRNPPPPTTPTTTSSTTPSTTTTTTTTTPPPTTTTTTTTTPPPTTTTTTTTTTTPPPTTTTTTTTTPRPTTTTPSTTTEADIIFLPNGCPVSWHIHWLLPHETDCNLFYYCVFGELALRKCPRVLHFNPRIQVCDWPVDAGCTLSGKEAIEHENLRRFF